MSRALRRWSVVAVLLMCPAALAQSEPAETTPEEKIEQALEQRADFEFAGTPLSEVAEFLQGKFGIGVEIDHKSLEDLGTTASEPVKLHAKGITLRSALKLMLEQLELTTIVEHEMLRITTKDVAGSTLSTTVYDVRELVRQDNEEIADRDLKDLQHVITSNIEPETWQEVGGPGSIEPYRAGSALVISQTYDTHRQLKALLENLRTMREANAAAVAVHDPEALVLRVYCVSRPMPPATGEAATVPEIPSATDHWEMALADALTKMIAPGNWSGEDGNGRLQAIPGALFVRQTSAIHREVQETLRAMQILTFIGENGKVLPSGVGYCLNCAADIP